MLHYHRILRIVFFGMVMVAATLGLFRTANAAVTASLAVVGPNTVTGPCPVTVRFTGTISGPAGTVLTYSFNRFINGNQQIVNGATVTMPASGSITTNDAIAASSPEGNNTFDQIWVHNISGGQADVYSNMVDFSVTCASALKDAVSESPANVISLNELAVCERHAPATACGFILADSVPNNLLVLGWDTAKVVDLMHRFRLSPPDGYKIYRVDGGRNDLVGTQPFENVRVSEVPKPADGSYTGKCYAVTAYNAAAETSRTSPLCIGGIAHIGTPHTTLTPQRTDSRYRFHHRGLYYGPTGCGGLCVGWYHDSSNGTDFGDQTGTAFRTYLLFDANAFKGLQITRATLKLRNTGATGCLDRVSTANGDWWDNSSWMDGDFENGVRPTAENATGDIIDVTAFVRRWAAGAIPNNGLVLSGRNEDIGANDTQQCTSIYGSAVLDIEHY